MTLFLVPVVLAQAAVATPAASPAPPPALSMEAAVDLALERSKDLEAALLSMEAAALAPERLEGAYDWAAFAEGGVNRDVAPRTSLFEPEEVTTVPISAGLSRLFPVGTFLDVQSGASYFDTPFPGFRIPDPTSPTGFTEIPQLERGVRQYTSVTATHPLWGSTPGKTIRLQQSQIAETVAAGAAQAAGSLDQVLTGIHRGFWGWVLAVEALENANEAVKAAEQIRDQVIRKLRRGLADERDRLRAAAAVQQAVDQRLAAERVVDGARRALLDVVGAPGEYASAAYDLDAPVPERPLDDVVKNALDASLGLRALENRREAQQIVIALSDERVKPRLSAIARLREDALFPHGDDFDDDLGFTTFLGLRLDKTFGNAGADVDRRQARLELRRIDAEIARTRERIRTAAAEQDAAISSARARVQAAKELVGIQEARLREEQRNFDIGRAVLRDLIETRQQVTLARFLLDAARVSLRMAGEERALLEGELTASWRDRLARDFPAYRSILPSAQEGSEP